MARRPAIRWPQYDRPPGMFSKPMSALVERTRERAVNSNLWPSK